jgi:phosphate transport system substrate-binding protein
MNDEQPAAFQRQQNAVALHFPTVLGADVVSYNIPGITDGLNFTPQALAEIYLGKITKWNDLEIVKANPKVKLPAEDIVVTHRSDGSGTTYVWTDYLSKISVGVNLTKWIVLVIVGQYRFAGNLRRD